MQVIRILPNSTRISQVGFRGDYNLAPNSKIPSKEKNNYIIGRFYSMKKVLSLVLVLTLVLGSFGFAFADSVVVPTADQLAKDVKDTAYAEAYAKLLSVGVVQGRTDGNADLGATLTRAEAAKVILHMLGLQEGIVNYGPAGGEFSDVAGHWASQYISVAAKQGIVNGFPNGTFKPNDPVTEEQIVAMIVRALEWGPIVGGNYPYGEYGKALELKIIDKAPVTGKQATRGYAFEVAANSLTAQMAERKATQGGLTYEGEGYRTLLRDRLGVSTLDEAVVVRTARMDRDLEATEFEVAYEVYDTNRRVYDTKRENFVAHNKEFDATTILGDYVNVWYKENAKTKENEVIYLEKDSYYKKETGIVESATKDSIKLENGRTYKLDGAVVFVDNNEVKDFSKVTKGTYVTMTLDKRNEVRFIDGFDITVNSSTNTLDLVSEVLKVEENRFEFQNQNGIKRVLVDEKLIVYKDGKIASTDDIKEYDLVKGIKMEGQAKTTFVLVVGEKVTGNLAKISIDAVKSDDKKVLLEIDEKEYVADDKNFIIVADDFKSSEEYSDYRTLAEDLRDYVKTDVTLITVAGKVKALIAKAEPKTVNAGLVLDAGLKYQTFKAKDDGALNLLNGNDEANEVAFTKNPTSETIYAFNRIKKDHLESGHLEGYPNVTFVAQADNANIGAKVTLFYNADGRAFVKDGALRDVKRTINLGKTGNDQFVKLDKGTLTVKEGSKEVIYDIKDSTVFYTLNDKQNSYKAVKYADIKDSKALGDMYVNIVIDKDTEKYVTPTADVVVVTQGYFEVEADTEYGIVTYSRDVKDNLRYTIWNGEKEIEYVADKAEKLVKAGNAVTFELTGKKVGDFEEIKNVKEGSTGVLSKVQGSSRYTIDGKVYEVARNGLIQQNERMYDSNKTFEVSYVTENGKLRVLNYLKEAGRGSQSGLTVTNVSGYSISVRENGERKDYDIFGAARYLVDLIEYGSKVSFKLDSYGDIAEFTYIEMSKDVSKNVTVKAHDGLVINGNGYKVTGNLNIESDKVTVEDLEVTGTVTVASNVKEFTAIGTNFDTLTLNGGGKDSVHLEDVTVDKLNVNEAVRVVLEGKSEVNTFTVKNDLENVTIEVKDDAKVTTLNAGTAKVKLTIADTAKVKDATGDNLSGYKQEINKNSTVEKAVYDAKKGTVSFNIEIIDQYEKPVKDVKRADVKVQVLEYGKVVDAEVKSVKPVEQDGTTKNLYEVVVGYVEDMKIEAENVVKNLKVLVKGIEIGE